MELSPEEAFFEIAGAIGDLENATIRAATAQDIFGRAGTQLLPLMAAGADGIKALREEARELGIVFDQEAANAAANFNDALTRLKGAIDGIKITIGTELAPILTDLIDDFTDATKKVTTWTKENKVTTDILIEWVAQMALLLLAMGGFVLAAPGLAVVVKGLGVAASTAALAFAGLAAGIGLIAFGIIGLRKNAEQRAAVAEIEIEQTKFLAGETNNLAEVLEGALAKGYLIATDRITDFIAASKLLELSEEAQAGASMAAADALKEELNALNELERAKRSAAGEGVRRNAVFVQDLLEAGLDPTEAPALLDRLNRESRENFLEVLPPPETPSGLGLPDRIIIENNMILDGEVISRSVNDSLGHMIDDRQRVEGERP